MGHVFKSKLSIVKLNMKFTHTPLRVEAGGEFFGLSCVCGYVCVCLNLVLFGESLVIIIACEMLTLSL